MRESWGGVCGQSLALGVKLLLTMIIILIMSPFGDVYPPLVELGRWVFIKCLELLRVTVCMG
jgi:hypothetical protein